LPITDSCGSWQGGPQWEDDSRNPLNAEQIDEVGNWAASNPAYELFCVQAEVHHQRNDRSPSPDNTEAQVPDISSEAANDEDSDSLVNVNLHLVSSARSKLILRLAFFSRLAQKAVWLKLRLPTGKVTRCTRPSLTTRTRTSWYTTAVGQPTWKGNGNLAHPSTSVPHVV
jgi:hypothetical protein